MVNQIERRTGVQMDVRNGPSPTIHLLGNESALRAAVEEIENIILAVEEDVKIDAKLNSYLLSNRSAVLNQVKSTYADVYIELYNSVIRLRGQSSKLAAAKDKILGYDVKKEEIRVPVKQTGSTVGKGGENINKLQKNYNVSVNVISGSKSIESTIEIIGLASDVVPAMAELQDIIYRNEEVEETFVMDSLQRNMFLENSGEVLKEIQSKISETGSGSLLSFEKLSVEERDSASRKPTKLVVKTKRSSLDVAKELIQSRLDAFNASVVTMRVGAAVIPSIIGKSGATIKALQAEGDGANIDIDKSSCTVTIQSESEETRSAVIAKIEEIIAKNQTLSLDIEQSLIGAVFGELGKTMRRTLAEDIGAHMGMDSDDTHITVRGSNEQITEAAEIIKEFIAVNFSIEMQVSEEDEPLLLHGGPNSSLVTVEKEHNVKANFRRANHIVHIRGREENVNAAKVALSEAIYGGNGVLVSKIKIPDTLRGIVIGKDGSQLKQIETDHEGVAAVLVRGSDLLALRGKEDQVKKARSRVFSLLATAHVKETMPISSFDYEELTKPDVMRFVCDGLNVQVTLESDVVKIRGVNVDITDAKARILEKLTGKYSTSVLLEEVQVGKVKKAVSDGGHFIRINESTKAIVSLDAAAQSINITGKRANVKKAKFLLLKMLDFILPSQFAKVTLPKQTVKIVGNVAFLTSIYAETGAYLWLDRDLSCVHVRSTEPVNVAQAVDIINEKLIECDKQSTVIKIDSLDAWLVPKIIGKGGATIQTIRKESGCQIYVSDSNPEEDVTLTISGEEECMAKGKQLLMNTIEDAKKKCAFVDVPDAAMTAFIGKGGEHVKMLSKEYNVGIERTQREHSRVRINGEEDGVKAAVDAVQSWVREWEAKNSIQIIDVKESMIPAIVGEKGSVIRLIEKETGCRVNIDRSKVEVTLRGNNTAREEAEQRIQKIIHEQEQAMIVRAAAKEKENAARTAAREEERAAKELAAKAASDDAKHASSQISKSIESNDFVRKVNDFKSVPVGMARNEQSEKPKYPSKTNPHATEAGKELLNMLTMFSSSGNGTADINCETLSTVTTSSSSDSTDVDITEDRVAPNERSYYKSTSGILIRL